MCDFIHRQAHSLHVTSFTRTVTYEPNFTSRMKTQQSQLPLKDNYRVYVRVYFQSERLVNCLNFRRPIYIRKLTHVAVLANISDGLHTVQVRCHLAPPSPPPIISLASIYTIWAHTQHSVTIITVDNVTCMLFVTVSSVEAFINLLLVCIVR